MSGSSHLDEHALDAHAGDRNTIQYASGSPPSHILYNILYRDISKRQVWTPIASRQRPYTNMTIHNSPPQHNPDNILTHIYPNTHQETPEHTTAHHSKTHQATRIHSSTRPAAPSTTHQHTTPHNTTAAFPPTYTHHDKQHRLQYHTIAIP